MVISGFIFVFRAHTRRDLPARQGAVRRRSGSVACKSEFGQRASEPSATAWRERLAHGVSRGENALSPKAPSVGDRVVVQEDLLPPLRGSYVQCSNPRLTPWATFSSLLRSYLPQLAKCGTPGRADERRAALAILWLPAGQGELVFGL